MENVRVDIRDHGRPNRDAAIVLEDDGRVYLRASPAFANALLAAKEDPAADVGPLRFDDRRRGLAFCSALSKGVRASLLRCEFAAGTFELRAYVEKSWVRLTVAPGDFDPDTGWEFLIAVSEAALEAPIA